MRSLTDGSTSPDELACESVNSEKCVYSRFLIFLEQQRGSQVSNRLTQNQQAYFSIFLPTTSDPQSRLSHAQKCILKSKGRDQMARTSKHILRHDHFRVKYRVRGTRKLSNAVFNHFPLEAFSSKWSTRESDHVECAKRPFPSKTVKIDSNESELRVIVQPCFPRFALLIDSISGLINAALSCLMPCPSTAVPMAQRRGLKGLAHRSR